MKYLFLPLLLLFALFPQESSAGLLTCTEATTCNFCELANTITNIAKWIVLIATLIATLLLAYAGMKLVYSKGDVNAVTAAKELLWNVVIGIFIMLSAWMVVDALVKSLVGAKVGVWNDFGDNCGEMFSVKKPTQGVALTESAVTVVSSYYSPTGTSNVSSFSGNLTTYEGHKFDSNIISQVNYVARTYDLRVSGGHRTAERNEAVGGVANSLHLSGRAADFVGPIEKMRAAEIWAKKNGAKEVLIHDAGSGNHLHIGW